jgi:hypothetical protein
MRRVQEGVIEEMLHQYRGGMGGAKSRDGHELACVWHTLPFPEEGPYWVQLWWGVHRPSLCGQSALRADSWNLTPFLRDRLVGQLRHRCRV